MQAQRRHIRETPVFLGGGGEPEFGKMRYPRLAKRLNPGRAGRALGSFPLLKIPQPWGAPGLPSYRSVNRSRFRRGRPHIGSRFPVAGTGFARGFGATLIIAQGWVVFGINHTLPPGLRPSPTRVKPPPVSLSNHNLFPRVPMPIPDRRISPAAHRTTHARNRAPDN